MSTDFIIKQFANRCENPRQGNRVNWQRKGVNVYCEDNVLFSYGCHFALAVYLDNKDGKGIFIKNGDPYSVSTASHQRCTQQLCPGPTTSFSALRAANINHFYLTLEPDLTDLSIVADWSKDFRHTAFYNKDTKKYYEEDYTQNDPYGGFSKVEWKPPTQGMFIPHSSQPKLRHDDPFIKGYWHILGGCLIRHKDNSYLCALDENSYFVSQLPKKARDVAHAFEMLKPKAVKQAEKNKIVPHRQGEWFFIPTGLDDKDMASKLNITQKALNEKIEKKALPRQTDNSNVHLAKLLTVGKKLYANGVVRHPEHRQVKLGEIWHEVHKNTEIASWSIGGKFD